MQAALRARSRPATPTRRPGARAAPDPAKDHLWLPIGPTVVFGGQAGGRPRVAGRIRDLWMSDDGVRGYAGAANGGVWYTSDRGESWRPLGGWNTIASAANIDKPSSALTCGCLHVRFDAGGDEKLDEVFVGTGELEPIVRGRPFARNSGVGILRAVGPADAAIAVHDSRWNREATNLAGFGIYRIVPDPMQAAPVTTFVAASSGGLWTRTGAPTALWSPVSEVLVGGPGTPPLRCTDVAWVKLAGGIHHRLYVAVRNETAASPGLYVSSNGIAGPFAPVALQNLAQTDSDGDHVPSRLSLAVAPSDPSVVYVLGSGSLVWRLDADVPKPVQRVPPKLLDGQDDYNQAIAVHPTHPERLMLGGASMLSDGEYSASLYYADVTLVAGNYRFGFNPANNADGAVDDSYVGNGVHADVHAARFVRKNASTQIWIGCDGGVFRSLQGDGINKVDVKHSFIARNQGLAVLECGYVATHPSSEGHVVVGVQDNGSFERMGMNIWRRTSFSFGDGGSVVYRPLPPHDVIGQARNGTWNSTSGATVPPIDRVPATTDQNKEWKQAGFYSGADAIKTSIGAESRLALGSTRVWFSRDWGKTWATLPGLLDPLASGVQNLETDACVLTAGVHDKFRGRVVANRWADESRLYTLCERAVLVHDLIADPFAVATGGLRAKREVLSVRGHRKKEGAAAAVTVASPGPRLPEVGIWSDIATHQPREGSFGTFYVATTGDPSKPAMDTLWWFDGTSQWHATGLRNNPVDPAKSVPAPAYAVVVDPEGPRNVVYVGTAVGVWRGVFDKTQPRWWTWEPMSNGLPEAAVQDLSISVNPRTSQRILRAAMQARGVWEVDLSTPAVAARTLVRVHQWDTRREAPVDLADPSLPPLGKTLSWHASPDLRMLPKRGSRPPAFKAALGPLKALKPDNYLVWVLQTALHADDPLVLPTGIRTPQFEARLKAVNGGSSTVLKAFWQARVGTKLSSPKAFADPWNSASPTEADLHELLVDGDPGGKPISQVLVRCHARVHVQVHHRHTTPALPADVKVTLLRREITIETPVSLPMVDCAWTVAVENFLKNGGPPPVLAGGWAFADESTANAVRSPLEPVDARQSRTVSFDVNFSAASARGKRFMLVAVVHSVADAATLPNLKLAPLVLGCRFVAARSVEIE